MTKRVLILGDGYPENPDIGHQIFGLENVRSIGTFLFYGKTEWREGNIFSTGGRMFSVVGMSNEYMWGSLAEARERAYSGMAKVSSKSLRYRTDIAKGL